MARQRKRMGISSLNNLKKDIMAVFGKCGYCGEWYFFPCASELEAKACKKEREKIAFFIYLFLTKNYPIYGNKAR